LLVSFFLLPDSASLNSDDVEYGGLKLPAENIVTKRVVQFYIVVNSVRKSHRCFRLTKLLF